VFTLSLLDDQHWDDKVTAPSSNENMYSEDIFRLIEKGQHDELIKLIESALGGVFIQKIDDDDNELINASEMLESKSESS